MSDDQAAPASDSAPSPAPSEPSVDAPEPESPQIPVNEGLADAPTESISEPIVEEAVHPEPMAPSPSEPARPENPPAQDSPAQEPAAKTTSESEPQARPAATPAPDAPRTTPEHDRDLLKIARAKIQTNKQQKLEKILGLFATKEKITNNDVEKLLRCSDATARRYLNELTKQGKIKRIGATGAGVVYVKA